MFINLLVMSMVSCAPWPEDHHDSGLDSEVVANDASTESLDRMIETSETMLENLKVMNHNLEMIFRAVTGCSTEEECDMERARLQIKIDTRKE